MPGRVPAGGCSIWTVVLYCLTAEPSQSSASGYSLILVTRPAISTSGKRLEEHGHRHADPNQGDLVLFDLGGDLHLAEIGEADQDAFLYGHLARLDHVGVPIVKQMREHDLARHVGPDDALLDLLLDVGEPLLAELVLALGRREPAPLAVTSAARSLVSFTGRVKFSSTASLTWAVLSSVWAARHAYSSARNCRSVI